MDPNLIPEIIDHQLYESLNFEISPFTCNEIQYIDLDQSVVRSILGETISFNKILFASGMVEPLFDEENVFNVFNMENHAQMHNAALKANKIIFIGSSIEIYQLAT
jgi:hypothetical protein